METAYVLLGFSLVISLIGYIWSQSSSRISKLELAKEDLKERTQRLEDVQGLKLDEVIKTIEKNKEAQDRVNREILDKVDAVKNMVYKEVNQENKLNKTLELLLKELSNKNETIH
jgi:hypothetical protein